MNSLVFKKAGKPIKCFEADGRRDERKRKGCVAFLGDGRRGDGMFNGRDCRARKETSEIAEAAAVALRTHANTRGKRVAKRREGTNR